MQQEKVRRASTLVGRLRELLDDQEISDNVKKAWLYWARSFLLFHSDLAPEAIEVGQVDAFLKHLEIERRASPASQRQALEAIRCLLEDVLEQDLPGLASLIDDRLRQTGPTVLTPGEVQQMLACLQGSDWLMASLVYGSGLRLMECVRLRVRDIEGERIVVRDRNGRFQRDTILPLRVRDPLRAHLEDRKLEHIRELADGYGAAQLPGAGLASSSIARSWVWQFLFPGPYLSSSRDSQAPCWRTHHPEPEARHAIEAAARKAGLNIRVTGNTLRNSFALHLIERGVAGADVERLLGVGNSADIFQQAASSGGSTETASPVDRFASH